MKETQVLFDVCNDYSLDIAKDQTLPSSNVYRKYKRNVRDHLVTVYYHKEYKELHYCQAPADFQDTFI